MKIKYINNRDLNVKAREKYNKVVLKSYYTIGIIVTTAILLLGLYATYKLSDFYITGTGSYIKLILIAVIIDIIFIKYIKVKTKPIFEHSVDKMIESGQLIIGEKVVEIIDDKMICKDELQCTIYNMKSFESIYECNDAIVICVQNIAPTIIIPVSAFDDEGVKKQFINLVKEKSDYIK
ncbi:hypothetical protein [Intestinibacter sp.]